MVSVSGQKSQRLIKIWNIDNGTLVKKINTKTNIFSIVITRDNKYFIMSMHSELLNCVKIFDINTCDVIFSFNVKNNCVISMITTSDNKYIVLLSGSSTTKQLSINFFDLVSLKIVRTIDNFVPYDYVAKGEIYNIIITVTNDNKYVIVSSPIEFYILEFATGVIKHKNKTVKYRSLFVTPDSKRIIIGHNSVMAHDLDTNECTEIYYGQETYDRFVYVTNDNKYLVTASDDKEIYIHVLGTEEKLIIDTRDVDHGRVSQIILAEDEKYIICGYDIYGIIKIWNFRNDKLMGSFQRVFDVDNVGISQICVTWNNKIY